MSLKVIGHISPDTDTVCSPIAYAWFLSEKKGQEAQAFVSGKLNKETEFILNRFSVPTPQTLEHFTSDDHLVIMDTNNPEELLEGIEEAHIEQIIDHHKLVGGLKTDHPITITMVPAACTATIAWDIMHYEGVDTLPKHIAGVMLCAIISDTLKFTSPTTTDHDKKTAEMLAQMCGENIDTLADEMFAAKSDLTGMSTEDILKVDSKVFEFGDKKARISVLETTKPENALAMHSDVVMVLNEMKVAEQLNYAFFFVIDIIKSEAHLIVASTDEKEVAARAFNIAFEGETITLPGIVSRKKQIIPALEPAIIG